MKYATHEKRRILFHNAKRYFISRDISFCEIKEQRMKENKLIDVSIDFSVNVINVLDGIKGHGALVNQLERSATSIGANIHEANYAQSKADFVSKLQIALKECYESEYWLQLFEKVHLLENDKYVELKNTCGTIRRLLISSITTAKHNIK